MEKIKVMNMPPVYTWWVGFLFTLGYIGIDKSLGFWYVIIRIGLTYIIWPYALGLELGLL